MFTGIVEELGEVVTLDHLGAQAARIQIETTLLADAADGDSIAVNGVCLTVTSHDASRFTADVMAETLDRSSLGALQVGSTVNLERPVTLASRLGGHVVQGHVDGVATITLRQSTPNWDLVTLDVPRDLTRYIVEKGSITLDGVSLTVTSITNDQVTVSLIPTTLSRTTFGQRAIGEPVNIEVDMMAKYVERLLQWKGTE